MNGWACSILVTLALGGIGCSSVSSTARNLIPVQSDSERSGDISLKTARPAPGKPGFVYSPYTDETRLIDVRDVPPGTHVRDPYSGRDFVVPSM